MMDIGTLPSPHHGASHLGSSSSTNHYGNHLQQQQHQSGSSVGSAGIYSRLAASRGLDAGSLAYQLHGRAGTGIANSSGVYGGSLGAMQGAGGLAAGGYSAPGIVQPMQWSPQHSTAAQLQQQAGVNAIGSGSSSALPPHHQSFSSHLHHHHYQQQQQQQQQAAAAAAATAALQRQQRVRGGAGSASPASSTSSRALNNSNLTQQQQQQQARQHQHQQQQQQHGDASPQRPRLGSGSGALSDGAAEWEPFFFGAPMEGVEDSTTAAAAAAGSSGPGAGGRGAGGGRTWGVHPR
jgi:hypothetical protein